MNQLTINHGNGHSTTYNLYDGDKDLPIAYNSETSLEVVKAIELARKNKIRVKIYLGDVTSGRCWNEENDIFGYIGLSRGNKALYPILVPYKSSYGGGSLLDHCIIKIKESKGNRVLYQSANFQQPIIEIKPNSTLKDYTHELWINGELYSNHKSERSALLLLKKLS